MSRERAVQEFFRVLSDLNVFTVEPYVVGPQGVGVLRLQVSGAIFAYVSFSYHSRYRALGAYVGFASPGLKEVTDACLLDVGRKLGVVVRYATAVPCPAVLFPLEFFLQSAEARPVQIDDSVTEWVRSVIYERVLLNKYGWVKERRSLLDFLAAEDSFSWDLAGVPRRLAQVAFLAHDCGEAQEVVERLVSPALSALSGDADFDECSRAEVVRAVIGHFYRA